jgi:SAM-dependent methyltransferase
MRSTEQPLPEGPWINLGSGPDNPSGWINLDGSWQARLSGRPWLTRLAVRLTGKQEIGKWPRGVVWRDLGKGLGYDPESLAVVYSSHLLEHLHRDEALRLLREIYRALRPGGLCRVVVPDAAAIVGWYLEHRALPPGERLESSSDLLMKMLLLRPAAAAQGAGLLAWYRRLTDLDHHKWMYDGEGLLALLAEAGFTRRALRGFLDSDLPADRLAAVEKPDRVLDGAGVCAEARKILE